MALAGFVLELLKIQEGLFLSTWLSLLWVSLTFAQPSVLLTYTSPGYLFVLFNGSFTVISVGLWVSLQFVWFQSFFPPLCVLFERLLLSFSAMSALSLLSWLTITYFGIESAPFLVFAWSHYVYSTLCVPRFSAFRRRQPRVADTEYFVLSYPESVIITFIYIILPVVVHVAAFGGALFTQHNFSNLILLTSLPLLGLRWMWQKRRPLWFLEEYRGAHHFVHQMCLIVPIITLPVGLCFRVLVPSYVDDMHIPQPWGYILVLLSSYAVEGAIFAHRMELFTERQAPLFYVAAVAVALGASVMLSAPILLWPVAAGAGVAAVLFYFSRKAIPYGIFVVCSTVCLVWFLNAKLAFVTFHFALVDMPLSSVLGLLASVFVGSFLVLGLLFSRQAQYICDAAFLVYSFGFAVAEWLLAYGHGDVALAGDSLYPEYFLLGTSAAGAYLSWLAGRGGFISRGGAWASACVWLAKTSALVCHAADSFKANLSVLLLLWAVAPVFFHWSHPKQLSVSQLMFHAISAGVAFGVVSTSAFARCVAAILLSESAIQSNALLVGAALAGWGMFCLLMSLRYLSNRPVVRAASAFIAGAGLILIAMQPDVGLFESIDLADVGDLFEGSSSGNASVILASQWLLVFAILLILALVLLPLLRQSLRESPVLRQVYSVLLGLVCTGYVTLRYLVSLNVYQTWTSVAVVVFTSCLGGAIVLVAQMIFFATAVVLPASEVKMLLRFLLSNILFAGAFVMASFVVHRNIVEGLRAIIVGIWALSEFVLALTFSVTTGIVLRSKESSDHGVVLSRFDRDSKQSSAARARTAGDASLAGIRDVTASEVYSNRLVGNFAALWCAVLSFLLSVVYLHTSSLAAVPLSTILLFISDDKRLFAFVATFPNARYVLAGSFAAVAVVLSSLHAALFDSESPVKNVLLILASTPSLLLIFWNALGRPYLFSMLLFWPASLFLALLGDVWPESITLFAVITVATAFFWAKWTFFSSKAAKSAL